MSDTTKSLWMRAARVVWGGFVIGMSGTAGAFAWTQTDGQRQGAVILGAAAVGMLCGIAQVWRAALDPPADPEVPADD